MICGLNEHFCTGGVNLFIGIVFDIVHEPLLLFRKVYGSFNILSDNYLSVVPISIFFTTNLLYYCYIRHLLSGAFVKTRERILASMKCALLFPLLLSYY